MSGLTRTLKMLPTPAVGADVEAWARGAHRYLADEQLDAFERQKPILRRTFGDGKRTLAKQCAAKAGLPQYGVVGPVLDAAMRAAGAYDARSDALFAEYADAHKPDEALAKALELLDVCRTFTGSYLYGGGHGQHLSQLTTHQDLDCSSSTSLALWRVNLFPESSYSQISGWFETWGDRGRGKYVTVHANDEHVWVELTLPDGWFRFDTSPHGDGPRGPRVRTGRRFDSSFVHRHPRGL